MRVLNLVQIELPIKEKVLYHTRISCLVGYELPDLENMLTQTVRHANMSKNRMTPVALPVQSQGTGDDFKL